MKQKKGKKKEKLSTVMLRGWRKVKEQAFGTLFYTNGAACALGCAFVGLSGRRSRLDTVVMDRLKNTYPALAKGNIKCLPRSNGDLVNQIIWCNDKRKMTVPAIAKGLRECGH